MRVLVCGGRKFRNKQWLFNVLDDLNDTTPISCIIEGEQRGADLLARRWAEERGIKVDPYKADWDKYGNDAGPIRNMVMLEQGKPDLVVAFPGNTGTANMVGQARRANPPVNVTEITE